MKLYIACEPEYLLPVLSFAQNMQFLFKSNVIQNILTGIGVHINDLGLVDIARLHSRLLLFEEYTNSKLAELLYLRASTMYQQMELASSMSEENISALSDFDNPCMICLIMSVLRFPKDGRLLSTVESVLHNQAYRDRRGRIRDARTNLAECLYLAEIFIHDQQLNNRNLYLPKYYKNFRRSETVCLLSAVFGVKYFEAAVKDLTNNDKDRINGVLAEFQNILSDCTEEIANRYYEAFDLYCNALDAAQFEIRNVGGIYSVLVGEDIGLLYTKKDAASYEGPLVKLHSSNDISPLYQLRPKTGIADTRPNETM